MNFKTALLFRLTTTDDSQWLHDGLCFFGAFCDSELFSVAQHFFAVVSSEACLEVETEEPQTQWTVVANTMKASNAATGLCIKIII
jgi:hypothetical protein